MGVAARAEIKKLQTLKNNLVGEVEALYTHQQEIKHTIATKKTSIQILSTKIDKLMLQNKKLTVSEHAIIRYVERVLGINIEDIENKILNQTTCHLVEELGNGRYPCNNDKFMIVVKDGCVVTVISDDKQ